MRIMTENQLKKKFGAKRLRQVWEDGDNEIKTVDWRSSISEVLLEIDFQLAPHGLEVIVHDTGDDNYVWHIAPVMPPDLMYQPAYEPEKWKRWDNGTFTPNMVYRNKKKAQADFPDSKILTFPKGEITLPIFVDDYGNL